MVMNCVLILSERHSRSSSAGSATVTDIASYQIEGDYQVNSLNTFLSRSLMFFVLMDKYL